MTRKILYVDDDLESRALVAEYLRLRGYEPITVDEASHALRQADQTKLDAIILDVNLIGLDGPELMELLLQKHPNIPVLLYTGMNPESEKVKSMLARGARQCVSKNSPLDALVKAVHDVSHRAEDVSRGVS